MGHGRGRIFIMEEENDDQVLLQEPLDKGRITRVAHNGHFG